MSCSHPASQFCGQRCTLTGGLLFPRSWLGAGLVISCRFLAALGPASCNLEMTVSTGTIFGSKKPVFSWQRLKSAVDPSILVLPFDIMANENDDGVGAYLVSLTSIFLPASLRNPWFLILRGWGMSLCFLEVGQLRVHPGCGGRTRVVGIYP